MKILLAIDGSNYSKIAIEEVANRVFPVKSEINIICVYKKMTQLLEMDPMGVLREYYAELDQGALKSARSITGDALGIIRDQNPELILKAFEIGGSPKSIILEVAETLGVDLIIVGSQGHGTVEGFLLGSVSQSVALHAKCSVEVVRKRMQNEL